MRNAAGDITMVAVSLLAPARAARRANLVVRLVYLVTVIWAIVGESWLYYVLGSVVEALLLVAIARVAWTWPRLGACDGSRPPTGDRATPALAGPAGQSA